MEVLLLADADILIHFYRAQKLSLLPKILPHKICLLDAVVQELKDGRSIYGKVAKILGSQIIEKDLDTNLNAYNEWFKLLREKKGAGESACMALARYEGHYIASNNLKDVAKYCKEHKIKVYTTMDLVYTAYQKGLMTKDDCDSFIYEVIDGGSNGLPCNSFDEYLSNHAGKNPWNKFDNP